MQAAKVKTIRNIELALAIIGAVACVVISVWLWQAISAFQAIWPFPALYLIEMAVLGLIAMFCSLRDFPIQRIILWVIVGLFLGFVILGVWSVGFAYLPVALILAGTAILSGRRHPQKIAASLGISLVACLAQISLMLLIIRLL